MFAMLELRVFFTTAQAWDVVRQILGAHWSISLALYPQPHPQAFIVRNKVVQLVQSLCHPATGLHRAGVTGLSAGVKDGQPEREYGFLKREAGSLQQPRQREIHGKQSWRQTTSLYELPGALCTQQIFFFFKLLFKTPTACSYFCLSWEWHNFSPCRWLFV